MGVSIIILRIYLSLYYRGFKIVFALVFFTIFNSSYPQSLAQTLDFQDRTTLMKRCWSTEQLKGTAREVKSRRSYHGVHPPKFNHSFPSPRTSPYASDFNNLLNQGTVRWVKLPSGQKLVALTLDLCEAGYEISGYDGAVIDYLRQHNIKATLFVGGKWMDHHSERAQQLLLDPLFEIGSHGWSHKNLRRLSGKALEREIAAVQGAYDRALTSLSKRFCVAPALRKSLYSTKNPSEPVSALRSIPKRLKFFRFPFGTCHKHALREVYRHGQIPIQWDVVTGDPAFGQSARRIAAIVKQRVKPGSIIIAHANGRGRNTAKALPLFIPDLVKEGYQFVTVSELLKAGEPQFASTCYENRPGDNTHY